MENFLTLIVKLPVPVDTGVLISAIQLRLRVVVIIFLPQYCQHGVLSQSIYLVLGLPPPQTLAILFCCRARVYVAII